MTMCDVNLLVANDRLAAWEDRCDTAAIEKQLRDAAETMGNALESLRDAIANIEYAADELVGTTEEDRVRSIQDDASSVLMALESLKESWR